jgi:hypothetical protein
MRSLVGLVTIGLIWFDVPAVAHHSFAAEFDGKKCIMFEGVVTEVEWTNPHGFFFLNIKQSDGHVVNWAFETAGPNTLSHLGWKRDSIKVGDHIKVEAYPAWDGARIASARRVVLADGRKIQAGSASDGGPQP